MNNFLGSALAAGDGTPEIVPHELRSCSLNFYLRFKHRNPFTQGFVPEPKDPE